MAMQVEVGSTLTSLANLSEHMNEAKLQRAFASPLSGAGSQPGELPSPLSPLLLEERGPFGNPLKPTTMTPATSRPRLTPKPFCREKSAETFAIVKPPVPALKPSNVAPKPSVFAKTFEDMSIVGGLTGNVPPLVDQKLVESKGSSDLVANMPFYSSPQANTVILFETGSTDRVRMTLTPDKNIVGVPRTLSTLPAQEGKLSSSKSEVSCRRPNSAGIHRQLSLSSESRPGSWNPCRPLERTDTVADAPEKKAKEGGEQPSSHISPASEVQARLKQRPVSAIFLESLKDQKHCAPDVSDEKPLPQKPWVRKPRPLSVDLTAKFENRDLSVPRKSCQFEVKEKNLVTHFADVGYSRPSEMGPKSETAGLGQADLSTSNLKTAVRIADSPGAKSVIDSQTQKPSPNEIAFSCHSTPKDLGQVSAKDRKYLWERKLKSQDEQIEREMAVAAASEKSKEPSGGKGQSVKERTVLNQKEICVVSDTSADAERRSSRGGRVKKLLNLPDTAANSAALVNTESLPESPEKESRILNIQQRIKELTAENADAKPGNLRRSVRSRPLSTDLTKLFSSPATSSEVRQAELNRKHFSETQEVHENGPDCREAHVLGPPWKPQKPIKIHQTDGHLEKDGSFARERQDATLQGEGPPSLTDHDLKPHSVAVAENACLKTVRATMFEHSVQRHNVAVDRLGTEPVLQPTPELVGGQLRRGKEPWLEKALENQTVSKKMPSKQADASLDAEQCGQATSLNEDTALAVANWEKYMTKEKLEKPTQKHIEDSLKYQRIEPRYEILQMVGERVQSEAIAAVSEDKAMTLRSRRSWKERRKTEEGVSWPCSLDLKGDGWREDGLVSKMKDPGEAAVKTTSVKAHNVSHSQQVFHEPELNESQTRQQRVTVKASYFPNRNKDLGTADDIVSSLSSELEKEKPEVCFADHMEGSKLLKHFPESFGAGQGRTDGNEARAYVGENMASTKAVEHESPSSLGGTSQWQKLSHKASHPIVDTTTYEQEDPKVLGLRKLAPAYCAKEELDVSGCLVEGERFVQLDVEERIRRGARGVSAPKATERWRRKTLPHGAARFEDAGAVAQESAKPLSRRDSLQLHNSSIAKKNREPGCGAEPREGGAASPGHPGGIQKHQLSPSEPKATYFTDTAQGPVENENASNPLKSKPISSVVENTSLHPNASTSRRSHWQHNRRFPDTPGSLDRHLSKSWGEGGTMDFPGPGGYKYERSDARCENKRSLERHLDDAKERSTGVDPLCQAEPKSPSCLRHFPQDRECSGQQKCSCCSQDITKGKGTGGYRSRVLDIDALMAEYKEDSKREGGHSEESSLFPWENLVCRRNSLDKTSGSYNSNNPKGLDRSPRSTREGFSATEFRWPENVHANEQEKGDCCSQESSPRKARDMTFSPPHWGRLFAEKSKYLHTDPISKRKKTFIIDEEQGESLMLRHHSAKYASGNMQAVGSIRVDTEPGAGCAPHPSQVLPGGVYLSKGMSPKQQASVRSEEDCCHETVHARGLNKRKGGTAVGCLETDASRAEARAEWNSSASGLANAPLDLKRSYSEKVRQARVRSILPSGPEVKEGVHQSSLPERVDGWLGKRSTSQQDSSFHGEKRQDLEKEQSKQGRGSSGVRSPPYLPVQRRSHSFYKERRMDHWAMDQLRECFGRPAVEAKDTDTLVQEADSQYGTWNDQRHSGDSFVPESPSSESNVASSAQKLPSSRLSSFSQTDPASVADQRDSSRDQRSTSLDQSSTDVDSADGTEGPAPAEACPDFSFLDRTPVLDSSALKTRVQLSKRRRQHRAPISHSLRRSTGGETGLRLSVPEEVDSAWMFQDCTEVKSAKTDDSDEEEKTTRPVERSPSSQPQRLPVFPGMDHSVLKAQLRKRQEMEGTGDSSPAQLSKSSKSPFQARALGGRVLPTGVEKEERPEEQSPQWLRELKSKKRQSQYENQV